ncbi:MAG: 2-dehydro-3-deoxy-6-phosphogalactonate aldolase [Sneathiella sp.]
MIDTFLKTIDKMPLVAILRGITPDEAGPVSDVLVKAGFTFLEVTLNSPGWAESMTEINARHGTSIVLGAGTVLTPDEVDQVQATGGQAIISPNMRVDVIRRTRELGMLSAPGCYTPTECFAALDAGAHILKIFPADTLGTPFIKAITAVLPVGTRICPTGGVNKENMKDFLDVGVSAMGMGSALYKPGKSLDDVAKAAAGFVSTYRALKAG